MFVRFTLPFKCFEPRPYLVCHVTKKKHLKIYNFRNVVHFLKSILQVVDNAVFWQNILLYFENDPSAQSEFLDVFYCGHVTYQIWVWFETFKGNVNRTDTVNFDAHWTSGAKKGGFEISLATDL